MKKKFLLPILVLICSKSFADIYGGEITYHKISGFTFDFTLSLYTTHGEANALTSEILYWGDGMVDTIPKVNQQLVDSSVHNIWKVDFEGTHTYPGIGTYVVCPILPNRISDMINVNGGNSVNESMYFEDTINLLNPYLFPYDYSPSFTHFQTDINFDGVTLTHDAEVIDSAADSITYELTNPMKGIIPVVNYVLPNEVPGTPYGQTFDIDQSGLISWTTPYFYGVYCVAIKVTLWKNGHKMGTLIRDMIIFFDAGTAVPEISSYQNDLEIFPNPVGNVMNIPGNNFQNASLEIFDALGRSVMKMNSIPETIDVSGFASGIYLMRIESNYEMRRTSFVKTK